VVAYLGRYTHRIAISHERLVAVEDGIVHFRGRDYRQDNALKVMGIVKLLGMIVSPGNSRHLSDAMSTDPMLRPPALSS